MFFGSIYVYFLLAQVDLICYILIPSSQTSSLVSGREGGGRFPWVLSEFYRVVNSRVIDQGMINIQFYSTCRDTCAAIFWRKFFSLMSFPYKLNKTLYNAKKQVQIVFDSEWPYQNCFHCVILYYRSGLFLFDKKKLPRCTLAFPFSEYS